MTTTVVNSWRQLLREKGYERRVVTRGQFLALRIRSRVWRRILRRVRLAPGASVLEVGCGGGNQLVPLALRGYRVTGLDCSREVLDRCRILVSDVERLVGRSLTIRLIEGDFLDTSIEQRFDLVFNFGVVEHYLDVAERTQFISRMVEAAAPGGYVVSVVPNGVHPARDKCRLEGLGGYLIPEIDYDCGCLGEEHRICGLEAVSVLPHNLFGYFLWDRDVAARTIARRRALYYAAQAIPIWTSEFACRHAASLIAVGRVPVESTISRVS